MFVNKKVIFQTLFFLNTILKCTSADTEIFKFLINSEYTCGVFPFLLSRWLHHSHYYVIRSCLVKLASYICNKVCQIRFRKSWPSSFMLDLQDCYLVYILTEMAGSTFMVFTRTCETTRLLALILRNLGFRAISISGQMTQVVYLSLMQNVSSFSVIFSENQFVFL